MPKTTDHLVAAHNAATARRAAGGKTWKWRIDVSDVFGNDTLDFEQRRDVIAARLAAHPWVKQAGPESDLAAFVEELADRENADEFDFVWDAIYDIADLDGVWIITR